jgi:hypothetical protein
MTGYIITAALQQVHTVVHTDLRISRNVQQTQDLENSLYQAQAYVWSALIFLGLSFGCLAIISLGLMVADMQKSSLTETSIRSTQTKLVSPEN